MKKYKQILAGLLAMNLAVYVMPTGMVQISASVQNQKSENTDTEKTESSEADAAGTADSVAVNSVSGGTEDVASVQTASEGAAAADTSGDFSSDDSADVSDSAQDNSTTDPSGDTASDNSSADAAEDPSADNTGTDLPEETPSDNAEDLTDPSDNSDSSTTTPSDTTEDLFTDGTQPEEAKADAAGEDAAVQAGESDSTIDLTNLKGYKKDTNTFDVTSYEELILLSYCKAEQIENIKINLQISGDPDITENNKIKQGDDISRFFANTANTTTVSDDESTQEDADVSIESNNEQLEETSQGSADAVQPENDSAEETEVTEAVQTTDTEDGQQADIPLQAETVIANQDYTFQGIGTESVPFQGEITGSVNTIKIDHTFFGGLSSKATVTVGTNKVLPLTWCGDGTKPMLAEVYQFDSAENTAGEEETNNHTLPVMLQGDSAGTMGSLIGTVQEAEGVTDQTLTIGQNVVTYTSAKEVKAVLDSGNAGLICNTLKSGNISLSGYSFPEKYTIQSTANYNANDESAAGNAGGLIGVMKSNTTLKIESAVTIPDNLEITSAKGNAGGLVGVMEQKARITTAENATITLNTPKITGGVSAGGVAGEATDVIFTDSDLTSAVTVQNPIITSTGTATGAAAGGFVGKYTLNAANLGESAENLQLSDKIVITTPTLTVNNSGFAGGYFGHLNLQGELSYTIGGADNGNKKEINPTYNNCSAEAAGAIAGKVTSDKIKSTLLIQNMTVQVTNSSDKGIQYHGGLVGEVGNKNDSSAAVYLNIKNVDVNINNPFCKDSNGNGFGGITGLLAAGSILKAEDNITVTTSDNTAINRGGGLVGYAEKSVLNVSGTTDLSGVKYGQNTGKNAKAGWLVGEQDCALIYANGDGNGNGWTYIRGKELNASKQAMNDIGNYGQIIRLKFGQSASKLSANLITITNDHTVNYAPKTSVTLSDDNISIDSEDAFALLSIVWNSRGYFGGVEGITSDNFSTNNPRSKNITLGADIDLTGSGIAGLSRDAKTDEDTYAGIFEGGNHTITLSIGETFGYKQDQKKTLASAGDDGYGEVIAANRDGTEYHSRQGLFAKVASAKIKNLNINGTINISNAGKDILAGGIAGESTGTPEVSAVNVSETINADCTVNTVVAVGGFYGGSCSGEPKFGTLDQENTLNTAAASINIQNCTSTTDETKIYAGGLIGEVNTGYFKLQAHQVKISGSIVTNANKYAYVGGLIGIVRCGDSSKTLWMEIKSVIFDGFKIDAPNATKISGGLFGSIWENVGLYFMGKGDTDDGDKTKLTVKNAEINAPKAKYVGGLAYRSSGKWEIRKCGIDLQKLTINAGENVGLLVCKGAYSVKNEETVAGDASKMFGALYLNTTQYWEDSYKISKENVSITTTNNGVFDEFVAYTTTTQRAEEINDNGKNGVISIATEEKNGERVGVDSSGCTTYKNRTEYGENHPTNAYSRYYYDLDKCLTDTISGSAASHNNNGTLDTEQELLLWSVYKYAGSNISGFFTKVQIGNNKTIIPDIIDFAKNGPGKIGSVVSLDMSKYSYYPIRYESSSINITSTEIKFRNEEIERLENGNKSTQGTNTAHTQHYGMHCGLFLKYQASNGVLTVRDVTFSGSIGKINRNASGVLVSDFASGVLDKTVRPITINVTNIILNGLKVTDCNNDYAPLLINNISDNTGSTYTYGYSTLSINGVTVENYTPGTAVASSLIGNVGSYKAKQINLTFQNIVLPDKRADGTTGIFSHATLLEHFSYSKDDNASGATYNFYSTDDWNGTDHKHQVTYGQEITGSTEFTDLQKWYYDESTYMTDDGLVYENVDNKKSFDASGYLPYVCEAYNEEAEKCMHEIKVNQRVVNITNGCGTYGHPYRITKEEEMKILSDYMATGEPRKDWRVTVAKTQDNVHTSNSATDYTSLEDVTYQYDGTNYWVQVVNKAKDGKDDWQEVQGKIKIGKGFMRDYLLNAYYDIQGTVVKGSDTAGTEESGDDSGKECQLVLNDFKGFGTEGKPFRGVLTSTNNTTLVLKGTNTGNGLIPYSYGSVVKNLKISYAGTGKTLEYKDITKTTYYPQVCFGGVIGCVLGGDNIIDNVTVDTKDEWKLTLSGDKKHLIQVGGYVGSVSGGGVIFRNMIGKKGLTDDMISNLETDISVKEDANYSLYVNPYVGRVLDGFAFYESDSNSDKLENTNKNYKINTLLTGDTGCVDASDNTVTVKDAQGLLILSAVINSGAGSDGISNAYSTKGNDDKTAVSYPTENSGNLSNTTYYFGGKYGKVRNASYSDIGKMVDDATLSEKEDKALPGSNNLPYLISKYCNGKDKIFSISTNSDAEIVLSSEQTAGFDMTTYGNGYQGIAARYVSNAVRGHQGSNIINHPEGVVPELKSFDGNNKTVTVNMRVREYADDDFHAASLGGIFNILRVKSNGKISNLTIGKNSENTNSVISLEYYDKNGSVKDVSKTDWMSSEDVGIGALAGSLVGYTDTDGNRDITIEKIQLDGLIIKSPANAGGIVGNIGKPVANSTENKINARDMAVLLQPKNSQIVYGTAFNECSYANVKVEGKYAAGGFTGYIGNIAPEKQNPKSTVNENDGMQTGENTIKNSAITATDNTSWAGGLFGYVKTRMFINITDGGDKRNSTITLQNVAVSAGTAVGGCIGYIDTKRYGIYNVTVKGISSSKVKVSLNSNIEGTFYAGGIVGYAKGGYKDWCPDNWNYVGYIGGSSIENVQINNVDMAEKHDYDDAKEIKTNYITGGIVGQTAGGKTRIESCTATISDIYGSVASGVTGQTDSQMEFMNCEIKGTSEALQTNIKGFSTAGGILGFWTGSQTVTVQGCKIQHLEVEGKDWGSGAIIGDAKGNGADILYLFDTSAQDSKVTAAGNKDNGGGRWPCVGSIIGNLRNSIKASNVLISNIMLTADKGSKSDKKQGLLFGDSNNNIVNIAGISIQNIPDDNKEWSLAGNGSVTSDNDYIAFADYSGTAANTSGTSQTVNDEDLLGYQNKDKEKVTTEVTYPYVVTSPKNATLKLYESESDTSPKYLYGDGASWSDSSDSASFTVKAQEIYKNRKRVTDGHYAYSNIPKKINADDTEIAFDFTSALSTFNTNNPTVNGTTDNTDQITPTPSENADAEQTTEKATDFPVLQIGSGSADTVTEYLDILTNGAFSAANKLNTSKDRHVTAQSSIYKYENGKFIKATEKDEKTAAFKVDTDSNGKITFSTTANYDNTQNRFNLLTVTFTEKDADKTAHHYNVFVPVLVRRMLEIDFKAALTYGTDFKNTDYDERITHVLESFGSSITGYLTYTYNSAAGTYTDYGWESYINAGGNVMEMKKSIRFEQSADLPAGTQLSLVDCRDGKVYYYTADGSEKHDNTGINIPLSSFRDSEEKFYQEPSISELIGAEAVTTGDKLFVEVDVNGKPVDATEKEGKTYTKPTVKIGKKYFRLAESGESGQYSIKVNESSLKTGTKSNVKENYYLVITVPESATGSINGSIQTSINSKILNNINYRTTELKNNEFVEGLDGHTNTASTYLLSSGYEQTLKETGNRDLSCRLSMSDSKLTVDVTDTITFPNDQIYNNNDELYMRFVGGLQKTISSNTSGTSTSAEQFPSGTTGTASFYVYTEKDNVKTYYTYEDGFWKKSESGETIAVSYPWTSTGGNMELPLSTDGKNAISLQSLRKLIKGNNSSGISTFHVELKMDATIPGAGLDVIPESKVTNERPEDYVKLTYYSQLSTEKQSLTYSSNRASVSSTQTEYYREEPSGVELTYDADKIDQLGINLLDLQRAYLDTDEQNTYIDTTATYDLSSMKNLKDTLKNSSGIKFTLNLVPKKTSETGSSTSSDSGTTWKEEYGDALGDAENYLSVELRSQSSGTVSYSKGTWSWTVPKESYYDTTGDQITTSSVFDGSKLRQAIRLKVNVANIESAKHFYSNYKVVLTAEISGKNNTAVADTHKADNIIYTLAKIKPEFVDSQTSGKNQ